MDFLFTATLVIRMLIFFLFTATLNSLVHYHGTHLIVATDPVCLLHPCGQSTTGAHDDTAELVDAKTKKEIEKLKKKRKQSMKL